MSSPSRIVRPRRGVALPLALLILVVSSLLAFGALTMSTQTFRAGRNALVEQRAFAVAEYGLNREVSNWKRERNLPPPSGMAYGGIDSNSVYVAAGDTARVKITRLGRMTFLVTSDGRASIGSKALDSRRSVSSYVRLAYPAIKPLGAITTAGNIELTGSAKVDGQNTDPPTWSSTYCDSLPGTDTYGVVIAPGMTLKGESRIVSPLKYKTDPVAADSNTYIRYGTETWNSLAANADLRIPGGDFNVDVEPRLDGQGNCDLSNVANWGEPYRAPALRVAPCEGYMPIIYVDGSIRLQKNGRGQGILMVNGDFQLNGNLEWTGLIVVKDDIRKGTGTAFIYGAVMSRNAQINGGPDELTGFVSGNQQVSYSSCALETVLRGSAILTRITDRPWTQVF